jgi:hypothetical protein
MSTLRTPVGPQPASVYWRRRLIVLLGLLAVAVVIILIVLRPGTGTPVSSPTTPAASPEPTTAPVVPGQEEDCDPAVVKVEPQTDALSYSSKADPMLSMSIENTGAVACVFNVGTDAQRYVITSGDERIWGSADCQTEPAPNPIVLTPGESKSTTPFAWDRTRSAEGECDNRDDVTADGASYHLAVSLGEATNDDTVQFVLE